MSKFQVILISIFVIFIAIGVTMFATYKNNDAETALPSIEIWGTFPSSLFAQYLQAINITRSTQLSINYVEISKANFQKQFIDTLARGGGPDAILLSQEEITLFGDKVVAIPRAILNERDFKNTYVPQAELYWTSEGSFALPFVIDPLVMYWNRDMFTNAGIATYPRYWDEFAGIIDRITIKDTNSNIRRSALAMGEFKNVSHARELLSTLLMQAGNPITAFTADGLQSTLGDGVIAGSQITAPALSFYTQFSNPRAKEYTWNRSLPASKSSFLSGNLATYFGFASELSDIRAKNPNIDFDVAPLPQARAGKNRVTYGSMYGFSIARSSANQSGTFQVLQILTSPEYMAGLESLTYLPSVRRDVIAQGSTDPYMTIFLDSALISRGWLDVNTTISNTIFTEMIESITSGRKDTEQAIDDAHGELELSLQNI
ncbi:MAG: extracellular solute-binding protein [Patescibacteria group bacterium]